MKFTQEEVKFICDELNITISKEENNENILEQIWEAACEIEIEESNRLDMLTPKGRMAVNLVTKLGENE